MKIALAAGKWVGRQIAEFMAEHGEPSVLFEADMGTDDDFQTIESLNVDLLILAWWPHIIKPEFLDAVGQTINLHPSLLPWDRGKHPNFWTLMQGSPYGVSIHRVDRYIDAGEILYQAEIPKTWEDTGETLYRRAEIAIVELFKKHWGEIRTGNFKRRFLKRPLHEGSFHLARWLDPASQIHLNRMYHGKELLNLLRARTFDGYPGAWFEDQGKKYEVRVEIKEVKG